MNGWAWAACAFGSASVLCALTAAAMDVIRRKGVKRDRMVVATRQLARDLDLPFPGDDA